MKDLLLQLLAWCWLATAAALLAGQWWQRNVSSRRSPSVKSK